MDNFNELDILGGPRYPRPLPPSRKISLIRTEVRLPAPCCSCRKSPGKLSCGRCKAIKYCGPECQTRGSLMEGRNGWKEHKEICNKIKKHTEETQAAIAELGEEFGGTEGLLQSPLVKEGRFKYQSVVSELWGEPPIKANNKEDQYILARMRLVEAYVRCGQEALNSTAFCLAAENMLDLLCLSYFPSPEGEHVKYTYCGWMVAGGMDQEALNYLCYFRHRELSQALPYLDLTRDEDVEGESYLKLIKDGNWSWFHDYMLIALVKYKMLQALLVQRKKRLGGWRSFLMGTHPRSGRASEVRKIRGNRRVVKRLKDYVMEEGIVARIEQLADQIKDVLAAVNERNPLIIPGLLDRNSIPEEPSFDDEGEVKDDELSVGSDDFEYDEHGDDIHDACWAYGNYAHAWNMSPAYTRVLRYFLDTGRVMIDTRKLVSIRMEREPFPIEGFLQAAFDVDPTRFWGDCDDLGIEGLVPRYALDVHFEEKEGFMSAEGNEGEKEDFMSAVGKEEEKEDFMSAVGKEEEKEDFMFAVGKEEEKEDFMPAEGNEGDKEDFMSAEGNEGEKEDFMPAEGNEEEKEDFMSPEGNEGKEEEPSEEKEKIDVSKLCWYCSKEDVKLYKCVGCRKARYCKEECQDEDWEVHGSYCLKQQEQRKRVKAALKLGASSM